MEVTMVEATGQTRSVLSAKLDEVTLLDEFTQRCVRCCLDCFTACEEMVGYCLKKGGKHAAYEHIRSLLDCAESCKTSVGLMARQSTFHPQQCALTAAICNACAESCERLPDPHMKACAQICRHCADICRRVSGASVPGWPTAMS